MVALHSRGSSSHSGAVLKHIAPESRGNNLPSLNRRALLRSAVIATILVKSAGQVAQAAATTLAPWRGRSLKTPLFSLPATEGPDVSLGASRGKPTLIHFFATWCDPCRDELPALARLAKRAGSEINIHIISVAEPDIRVRRFMETMGLKFAVLLDREKTTARAWDVTTLPTTIVLDADLRPRLRVDTDFDWDITSAAQLRALVAPTAKPAISRNS